MLVSLAVIGLIAGVLWGLELLVRFERRYLDNSTEAGSRKLARPVDPAVMASNGASESTRQEEKRAEATGSAQEPPDRQRHRAERRHPGQR